MSGTAAGLLAVAMWCVTSTVWVLISTVPPIEMTAIVFFIGFLSMTAVQIIRKEDMISYWKRPLSDYAFWLGTAGFYTIIVFIAFRAVPVFEANILTNTWPVMLFVLSAIVNKTRLTALHIIGGLLGLLGVIAIFLPSGDVPLFSEFHWGHALALFSALVWALYSALARRVPYPPGFLGPVFFIFSLICLALHLSFEETVMPGGAEWVALLVMGVLRVSYALWDYGMKKGDVILLASACYFIPLISSLAFWALDAGPARPMIGIGAAMVIAGCLIVNYRDLSRLAQRLSKQA
jgi:drug/metabolite transporter (DMT)-like permease